MNQHTLAELESLSKTVGIRPALLLAYQYGRSDELSKMFKTIAQPGEKLETVEFLNDAPERVARIMSEHAWWEWWKENPTLADQDHAGISEEHPIHPTKWYERKDIL